MIIRVTQKLAKKIKVAPPTALPRDPNPFADWTANLFTTHRTQYIILTNSASLYSIIFYGRGITEGDIFIDHAFSALSDQMRDAGYGAIFEKHIAPLAGEFSFSKTGDRSLLGSMNDHVRCASVHLEYVEESLAAVAFKLNETPMGALDYRYPQNILEMLAGMPTEKKRPSAKIIPFPRKP